MPPAVNATWGGTPVVIAVLDNEITGMTGHQPNPASGYNALGEPAPRIKIEEILEAAGVKKINVVDPFDLEESKEAFKEVLQHDGPSTVVLRRMCALVARRQRLAAAPRHVDVEKCTGCLLCVRTLSCPAMEILEGKMEINQNTCEGCVLCAQVCFFDAISGGDR